MWLDYVFVLFGIGGILGALFGTKFYYSDEFGNGDHPAPVRSSKVFFFVMGSIFSLVSLLDLFGAITLKKTDW